MRAYDEFAAAVFDVVPPQLMLLLLLAVTALTAALWYWYPAWIPRRFPRLRAPRVRTPKIRLRLPRWKLPRLRLPRWDWRRLLRDLLRFRRGEDEDDAGGWFLQDLEQRVPRFPGEHVGFVDDVHLVVVGAGRGIHRALAEVSRIVHPAVTRGVDFHHVQIGAPIPDPETALALPAGLALGLRGAFPLAVEGHRENPGRGRLPYSAGTGQQVAMTHPVLHHGTAEHLGDMVLNQQITESFGAVFAGER